ncbi:Dicer-like protein 2 [Elasticomyces elasticus]|nr:Dicer-like protein 2 [Elasticomyces elasticus]
MLLERNADQSKVARWHELEDELAALCQQERQQAEGYSRVESEDEPMDYTLRMESTGVMLDADSTLQHLHHFCQLLQSDSCIEPRPDFSFHEDQNGRIGASFTLPHSIAAHASHAPSKRTWRTEKAAKKDAAFHAYAALFEAGLLNDHLLPISQEWNDNEVPEEVAPPARLLIESLDLWARSENADDWYKLEVQIILPNSLCPKYEPPIHMVLNSSQQPSTAPPLKLY